ncbi:SseB family protein [Eubacterium sp.]
MSKKINNNLQADLNNSQDNSENVRTNLNPDNVKDEGLKDNIKIEKAIAALQQESTQEKLAHTLTVIRRRMKEKGRLIIAVEPPKADGNLNIQAIKTDDGRMWWMAFTSFDEEIKGSGSVMSTFMCDIDSLFATVLKTDGISGIIINPWNRTIMLDKRLISIIIGK